MQFAGWRVFVASSRAVMIVSAENEENRPAIRSGRVVYPRRRLHIAASECHGAHTMSGNGRRGATADPDFEAERLDMVASQIRARGILSPRVLDAMQRVPRHLFVPQEKIPAAYADEPLPIGEGQTISQPFMVAAMTQALSLQGHERVLDVGSGSGYQAAILALLVRDVIGIESQPALANSSRERLARLGYSNVRIEVGDGSLGFPEAVPYDAILVAAAGPSIPPPLVDQLADGGRLVIPVGTPERQQLIRLVKKAGQTRQESLYSCRFVPLLGEFGWRQGQLEITSK